MFARFITDDIEWTRGMCSNQNPGIMAGKSSWLTNQNSTAIADAFSLQRDRCRLDLRHLGEMEYLGKASIRYLAEEACHGVNCRKYVIGGEAFGGRQGYLWVNKEGGYSEKVEIPVRDNPSWKDFKLELTGRERMSGEQWKELVKNQTKAFFTRNR